MCAGFGVMGKHVLMSPVDAAGYAMAPPEDDLPAVTAAPDAALRNGHRLAARGELSFAPSLKSFDLEARGHGVMDSFAGWWSGKAHA